MNIQNQEHTEELVERIIARIRREEERSIRLRSVGGSVAWTVLFLGCIGISRIFFMNELVRSDFFEIVSTVFANGALFSAYWQESMFAILESIPVMSAMSIFASFIVFLWSVRSYRYFINHSFHMST